MKEFDNVFVGVFFNLVSSERVYLKATVFTTNALYSLDPLFPWVNRRVHNTVYTHG